MDNYLQTAKDLLAEAKTLPALPSTTKLIIESTSDPFVDIKTVVRNIELDPLISARIVGISNSSIYGVSTTIYSVEEAIIRVLGLDLARGIAIGMSCSSILGNNTTPHFDCQRFWHTSLQMSALARLLANYSTPLEDQSGLCSLSGLLTYIGVVVAVAVAPEKTEIALSGCEFSLQTRMQAELGCDYRHFTAVLAENWTLPESIQQAFRVRCDDGQRASIDAKPLTDCLTLSNWLRHNDPDTIDDLSAVSTELERLELTLELKKIAEKHQKSQSGLIEVARVIAA